MITIWPFIYIYTYICSIPLEILFHVSKGSQGLFKWSGRGNILISRRGSHIRISLCALLGRLPVIVFLASPVMVNYRTGAPPNLNHRVRQKNYWGQSPACIIKSTRLVGQYNLLYEVRKTLSLNRN